MVGLDTCVDRRLVSRLVVVVPVDTGCRSQGGSRAVCMNLGVNQVVGRCLEQAWPVVARRRSVRRSCLHDLNKFRNVHFTRHDG